MRYAAFLLIPVLAIAVSARPTPVDGPAVPRLGEGRQVLDPPIQDGSGEAAPKPKSTRGDGSIGHPLDLYDAALADARDDPSRARARFAEAAAAFDAIESKQPVSAEFFRAQGNAHFFSGDIGRAVLAYRRGLERRPGDPRLSESLRVARKAVRTDAAASTSTTLLDALAHWRRFVSPVLVASISAAAWFGLWGVLVFARVRRVRAHGLSVALLAVVSIAGGAALGADAWRRMDRSAVVVVDETEGFNGPSSEIYEATFASPLAPGVEAELVEARLGWMRLRLRSGSETWVRRDAVIAVQPAD